MSVHWSIVQFLASYVRKLKISLCNYELSGVWFSFEIFLLQLLHYLYIIFVIVLDPVLWVLMYTTCLFDLQVE